MINQKLTQEELFEVSKSLRKVDTQGATPHTRHLAAIQRVAIPGYDSKQTGGVLNGEIAITSCGKILKNYWDATQTKYNMTDGSVYSKPCARCLPHDAKQKEIKTDES